MRAVAGFVALNALLLVAGFGILYGLGLVRSVREALHLSGLALLVGFVGTSTAVALVLTAGSTGGVRDTALVGVAFVFAGILVRARVGGMARSQPRPRLTRLDHAAVGGSVAALVVYYGALLWRAALSNGPAYWDPWWFWLPKAKTIFLRDGLVAGPGGFTNWANPDYPPLVAGFDALVWRFIGDVDVRLLALELWMLEVGFVAGVGALLGRRAPAAIVWPVLLLVVLTPSFRYVIASFLADEILVLEFGLAAVCGAMFVLERDARWCALCTIFLAGVVLTKNEGLLLYALLAVIMLSLSLTRRTIRPLAALVAVPLAVLLPWKLWLRAHDVPPTPALKPSDLLDPDFIAARSGRFADAAQSLASILLDRDYWLVLVPLVLVTALVGARAAPRIALLVVGLLVGGFASLVVVYGASPYDFEYVVNTSASRVVTSSVVASALALPLHFSCALSTRVADPSETSSGYGGDRVARASAAHTDASSSSSLSKPRS